MDTSARPSAPERRPLSPSEAAEVLGCSRSEIYRLLRAGKLTARKLGKRTLIDRESIDACWWSLPHWQANDDE